MKDPVRATVEVMSCHAIRACGNKQALGLDMLTGGLPRPTRFNAILELDVSVPGAMPYRLEQRCNVPTERWPQVGGHLPVTADRTDPLRIRIHWGEVPSPAEVAAQAQITAALRELPDAANASMPEISRLTGEAKLLRGADEIGDASRAFAASHVDDGADRLERLTRLHVRGVLTGAEFEREKQRAAGP
jgi:hypothetical protein